MDSKLLNVGFILGIIGGCLGVLFGLAGSFLTSFLISLSKDAQFIAELGAPDVAFFQGMMVFSLVISIITVIGAIVTIIGAIMVHRKKRPLAGSIVLLVGGILGGTIIGLIGGIVALVAVNKKSKVHQ